MCDQIPADATAAKTAAALPHLTTPHKSTTTPTYLYSAPHQKTTEKEPVLRTKDVQRIAVKRSMNDRARDISRRLARFEAEGKLDRQDRRPSPPSAAAEDHHNQHYSEERNGSGGDTSAPIRRYESPPWSERAPKRAKLSIFGESQPQQGIIIPDAVAPVLHRQATLDDDEQKKQRPAVATTGITEAPVRDTTPPSSEHGTTADGTSAIRVPRNPQDRSSALQRRAVDAAGPSELGGSGREKERTDGFGAAAAAAGGEHSGGSDPRKSLPIAQKKNPRRGKEAGARGNRPRVSLPMRRNPPYPPPAEEPTNTHHEGYEKRVLVKQATELACRALSDGPWPLATDVDIIVASLHRFASDIILPALAAVDPIPTATNDAPVILGTLLMLREVLILNADGIFGMSNGGDSEDSRVEGEEREYVSQSAYFATSTLATAVLLCALDALDGTYPAYYSTRFLRMIDAYESGQSEFAQLLMEEGEKGVESAVLLPSRRSMSAQEQTVWRSSCKWHVQAHPTVVARQYGPNIRPLQPNAVHISVVGKARVRPERRHPVESRAHN